MTPDPRRLQSMRRARARLLIDRGYDQATAKAESTGRKSRWKSFLLHPITALIFGGIIGLASGWLTASINYDLEVEQYWRDKRLDAYSAYYAALNEASGVELQAQVVVETLDESGIDAIGKQPVDEAIRNLNTSLRDIGLKFQPVQVLASEPVGSRAEDLHRAHQLMNFAYQSVLLEYLMNGRSEPDSQLDLAERRRALDSLSPDEFLRLARSELDVG